jgi:hypothetical protein
VGLGNLPGMSEPSESSITIYQFRVVALRRESGYFQQRYVKRHEIWHKPPFTQRDMTFRGSQNQIAFRPLILGA